MRLFSLGALALALGATFVAADTSVLVDIRACKPGLVGSRPVAFLVGSKSSSSPAKYADWTSVTPGLFTINVPSNFEDSLKLRIWLTDERQQQGNSLGLDFHYTTFEFRKQPTREMPSYVNLGHPQRPFNDFAAKTKPQEVGFFPRNSDPFKVGGIGSGPTIKYYSIDATDIAAVVYCRRFGDKA